MPTIRYEIRSEYGLADPELLRAADKDDPEAVLEGVAMSGLVGVLRQLGDLAEFATEIFHELHEEVMCTAARGHGLKLRVQQLEAEFPPVEKAFFSHPTHSSFTYNEGTDWHANIRIDQNLITQGDMPRFILDSYEECRGPPRLFMLDKFDIAGAGACLKRYSDPSFFKTELTSRGMIDVDIRREKKPRKVKKKTSRGKLGQTLESLLSPNAESSSGLLVPSEVLGKPVKRLVRLKSRHLNRGKEIKLMDHLLELHSDVQKVVLDSSQRQSNGKVQLKNVNELTSKLHDAVKDKSISHPLPSDENIITSIEGDKRLTQTCNLDHQKIEDDLREEPHECYEVEDTSNNNHLAVQNEIWADLNVDDHALDDAETIAIPKDKNTITSLEVTKLMSTYELEYQMIEDELPDISHETAWKVKEVKNNKHPGENKIESDSMTKSGDSSNENKLDQSGDGFIENKLDESGDSSNENKLDDAGTIPFPRGENTDKVIRSTPINELQYELTEALDKATCEVEEADKSIHHQELNQMMADSKTMSGDSVSDYQLSDAEKTTLLKEGDTTTSMDESIRSMPMNKTEYQKIENPLLEEPNKEETFNRIHLIEHKELITDSETRKGDGISTYEFGDSEFSMLSHEAEKTLNGGELKLQCTGDDDRSQGTGSDLGNFMESLNSMESEVEVNSEKKNKPLSVDAMYLDSDEHQVQNSELVSTENTIAFMESEVELNSEKKDKPLILDAMYLDSDEATDEHRVQKYELVSAENTIAFKESEVEVHSEKKDKPLSVHAMYLDSGEVTDEHRVQNSELVPVEKTTAFDLNDILDDKISCLLMSDSSYTMSETQIIQEVSITSNLERSFEMHLGETQDNMTEELEVVVTVSSSASKTCDIEIFNGPGLRSDHMEASSYGSSVIESTCDLNISQECHDDLQTHTAMQNDISTSSDGISDRTAVGKNFDGLPHLNIDIPGDFHPIEHMDGLVSEDKSGSDELFVCVSPTTNHNSISVISLTEDSLVTTPGIREMQELDDMSEEASLGENTHSSPDNVSVTAVHPHVLAAETPNNLPIKCLSEEILSNGVEKSDLANNIQGLSIGEEVHHDHENSYSDNHSLGITTHDMAVVSDSDGHLVDMTDQHNEFHVGYTPDSLCPLTLQSEVTEELLVEDKKRCSSEIPDLNFSLTTEINDDLANTSANSVSSVEIEGLDEISNSQIKMSAQQSEQNHFFDPEEHQTIEADSEGEKGALIDHVQPHLCPNDPEIIESVVVNLRSADERYSSEEKKTIKENANSEYSHEKVAVKDEDANHDISSLSSPEASCSQELLNDNSMHDTAISYPYDVTQVPEKCNQNNNVCLISQSILEMTVESLEQPELDDTVPDPHLQLLEEVSSDKSDSLVHALSKDQPKSQSSVDDSEWSLDRKQGEIQKSPEQSHHDNANEEMFVYTNVSSKSETLPEEEIKLQVSKEENLTYLRKSDEYFELDTLSVSSDIVTIPVEEADKRPATSGEHIIFHTAIEDNTTTSSQLDEYLEVYTNTNPSGFNDNTLIEGSEANVITFDNNDEHIDLNKSSSNIDTMRQIESGLFPSSGIVSALSASTIESNVTARHLPWIPGFNMTSNKGSSQVSYSDVLYQSSCAASQDIEEAPPLPPLPPLEWRSVKLRDNSLSSFGISFQNLSETSSLVAPPPAQCNSKHASLPEGDKMILSPYSLANIPTFETKSFQESSLDPCGKWGMPQELSQCPPIVHDQRDGSCQQQLEEEFMDLSRTSLQYETSSYGPGESKEPKLEPSFSPFTLEDKTSQHLPDVEFELLNDSQNINLDLDEHQNLSLVGSAINYDEGHSGNRTLKSDNDHFSSLEPSRSTVLEISHPGYAALLEENQSPYFGLLWRLEDETPNVRPCSVRNRPRDPLIEAVAAHDRSTLRKVSDLVRPSDGHKEDERNSMLEQIRNKAFSLRPAVVTKHNTKGPSTNLKVAAIIEKANAIRQACAGSDEDDDADSWSDS